MKVADVFKQADQLLGQEITIEGLLIIEQQGKFIIDPDDLQSINLGKAVKLMGDMPRQRGGLPRIDGDYYGQIVYQMPDEKRQRTALNVSVVGQLQKSDQEIMLTELKAIIVHDSTVTRYLINTPVNLNKFRLSINEITELDDILASPERFLGKRVRVGGNWIDTSAGSYLCGTNLYAQMEDSGRRAFEDSRKRALQLISQQFEAAIANGSLMPIPGAEIFLDETNEGFVSTSQSSKYAFTFYRLDEMQVIGEITEATKEPFPLAITNIYEAAHITAIGVHYWHLPRD